MHERIYTIRGKLSGASTQHEEIQLNFKKYKGQNYLFRVRDFRVYTTAPNSVGSVTGALTKSKDNNMDPSTLNLEDENLLAWAQQIRRTPIPPGLGEVATAYSDGFVDLDSDFGYSLFVHTNSVNVSVDVNYYLVVEKYKASEVAYVAESISQYQLNTP